MISVVHTIWSGNFGGIEKLVFDLCAAQKMNPELRVGLVIAKKEGQYLENFSSLNIPCHFIGLKSGYDFSFSKVRELEHYFRGFDVIHIHSFNPFVAYAAIRSGKKIVFTEHGVFGFGREKKKFETLKYFLLKTFLKKYVNYVSFNSGFTEEIAMKRYHLNKKKCEVIYNGVDLSEKKLNPVPDEKLKRELEGKFVIGTSSRFAGFKRIDRLISAFSKFQQDKNTVLLLVGDGVLRHDLEQQVHELKIGERTIFTGFREDVRQLQQMMDVCVFPSENEPFGLVAIETLSLGKRVLVFRDGGGIAELIEKISPQDIVADVNSLTERLEFYYGHREEISNGAQQRIQFAKLFDVKVMEEKFFRVYKGIVMTEFHHELV